MEVAKSLKKRDGFSIQKGLLLWTKYFLSAEYLSRKHPRIFLSFDSLLQNTKDNTKYLTNFISIDGRKQQKEIDLFLDKSVKHNNQSIKNISDNLPAFLENLLSIIKKEDFSNHKKLDTTRKEFSNLLDMFKIVTVQNHVDSKEVHKQELQELSLLKKIVDVAVVDQEYYKDINLDIKNYSGDVAEHYYLYGKSEARMPNEYCATHAVNTKELIASDEQIYQLKQEIESLQDEISGRDATLESKMQELDVASQTLNKTLQDLAAFKENKAQEIESLQDEISSRDATLESKTQEIEKLSFEIDTIVRDLVNIKESKCWIYTKPLRDLHETIKGKDV